MKSILIVEDDALIAEMMATAIASDEIEIVGTLGEALAAINRARRHLILLDLTLPDSNSANTLKSINRIKQLGADQVIIVTGSPVDDRLLKAGLDAGAADVIGKDTDLKTRLGLLSE